MELRPLQVRELGLMRYDSAYELQLRLVDERATAGHKYRVRAALAKTRVDRRLIRM